MSNLCAHVPSLLPVALEGRVAQTLGASVAIADFPAPVGAVVVIEPQTGGLLEAEVIGFRDDLTLAAPLGRLEGVGRGCPVRLVRTRRSLGVGPALIGRVLDAHGRAIDGGAQPAVAERLPLESPAPPPLARTPIDQPLATGVRAIDSLLCCGRGQRLGVFAGAGVGKSTLLGMIARQSSADVNVIAMVGERGREVRQFLEQSLGEPGLKRSVVMVATGDEPPLVRVQAALAATAVSQYFREQGRHVLLLVDSMTRLALAQREIGLAAGEPPAVRGFPSSALALLPRLVERAGTSSRGSITAFYSVLVEGDDPHEPVADTLRGLLDGHVWLSSQLAARGHWPAVDVLQSISRLMPDVASPEQLQAAQEIRGLLAAYREHEDLISIGAYRTGTHPQVDAAIAGRDRIERFLRQAAGEPSSLEAAREGLLALHSGLRLQPGAEGAEGA